MGDQEWPETMGVKEGLAGELQNTGDMAGDQENRVEEAGDKRTRAKLADDHLTTVDPVEGL